jgi:hypothetical protein
MSQPPLFVLFFSPFELAEPPPMAIGMVRPPPNMLRWPREVLATSILAIWEWFGHPSFYIFIFNSFYIFLNVFFKYIYKMRGGQTTERKKHGDSIAEWGEVVTIPSSPHLLSFPLPLYFYCCLCRSIWVHLSMVLEVFSRHICLVGNGMWNTQGFVGFLLLYFHFF